MPANGALKELFLHELKDLYYAERVLEDALATLAEEADDTALSEGFEYHRMQTQGQISNLEQVFELLGEEPSGEQCPGIDGIKAEHDQYMEEESPRGTVKDVFLTGAAARAEAYEIAAYSGLVLQAKALGEDDAATLLGANLEQERHALQRMEIIGRRLAEGEAAKKSSKGSRRAKSDTARAKR